MRIPLLVAVALFPASLFASTLSDPVLPAGVGINIHFSKGHEHDLDMIAAAGFKVARMDVLWVATERVKGSYDWSAYDDLTASLERRGIRPYYILCYGNPLYEETIVSTNPVTHKVESRVAGPQHPESIAAFVHWAAAAAKHFRGRGVIWEIWNEPNGGGFWKPKPDVAQYTTLALATCQAVRKADPQATIVAPACAGLSWPFLEGFFKSGVLAYLDGVSVHPYRKSPPETVAADYQRLRELIARYAPKGKNIPIISGEWGYSTFNGRLSWLVGVSLQTQADYIARQQLFNLLSGVPVSIWYDWVNDGLDPAYDEDNFGTVTHDLKPKPAYVAIQTLTHELSGYRISGRYGADNNTNFVLALTNAAGAIKLAAWTLDKPHTETLALSQPGSVENLSWVDGSGDHGTLKITGDNAICELSGTPKYITLGTVHLKDATSAN